MKCYRIFYIKNGIKLTKLVYAISLLEARKDFEQYIQKLPELVSLVKSSQGINYCLNLANEYINKAIKSLEPFQDSSYKKIMIDIDKNELNEENKVKIDLKLNLDITARELAAFKTKKRG
jgi:geranylgeranyl pyrophosphate synthase